MVIGECERLSTTSSQTTEIAVEILQTLSLELTTKRMELWRSLKDMGNAGEEQEPDADAPPRHRHEGVTEAVTRC
jgi:hypothetical protein